MSIADGLEEKARKYDQLAIDTEKKILSNPFDANRLKADLKLYQDMASLYHKTAEEKRLQEVVIHSCSIDQDNVECKMCKE